MRQWIRQLAVRDARFKVTATDSWAIQERDAMFKEQGIEYSESNLNDPQPFKEIADESFQLVLLGEVFEHVLNHPLGFCVRFTESCRGTES